jgi:uncharacterized protein (DUF1499 family)
MGGMAILGIAVAALAVVLAIRLLPSDPAVWHQPVSDAFQAQPGPCANQIRAEMGGARAVCLRVGAPEAVLDRLSAIAMAYPRTVLLAGTPAEGRITWVSRSKVMGFPDYITAEATTTPQGARLAIHSRLRFGRGDMGVNAARLKAWLTALDQT